MYDFPPRSFVLTNSFSMCSWRDSSGPLLPICCVSLNFLENAAALAWFQPSRLTSGKWWFQRSRLTAGTEEGDDHTSVKVFFPTNMDILCVPSPDGIEVTSTTVLSCNDRKPFSCLLSQVVVLVWTEMCSHMSWKGNTMVVTASLLSKRVQ